MTMARSSASAFSFVVATDPEHFKDRKTLRKVRQAVMKDYLTKANQDPSTKDRRITHKRKASRKDSAAPCVKPSSSPPTAYSRSETSFDRPPQHLSSSPPDEVIALDVINPAITPFATQHKQAALVASVQALWSGNDAVAYSSFVKSFLVRVEDTPASRKSYYAAAYYNEVERSRLASEDGNSPVTTVNLEFLKIICTVFYGSLEMQRQWTSIMIQTPIAFLSSLCVAAPYADLLMSKNQDGRSTFARSRQTLEILSVIPRMINERLCDPEKRYDDQTIVSIVQAFYGQLTTPFGGLPRAHQNALKEIVTFRGGLHKIGGNGIITKMLILGHLVASILRDDPLDDMYKIWVKNFCMTNSNASSPEGPFFRHDDTLSTIASDKLCTARTISLIQLVRQLNDIVIGASDKGHLPDPSAISDIITKIHGFEPRNTFYVAEKDWIYESIRLAALRWCHAIWQRCPLHHDVVCDWTGSDGLPCQDVTLELMHDAIKNTPMNKTWGHLVGVLQWVMLVAGACCYNPVPHATTQTEMPPLICSSTMTATEKRTTSNLTSPARDVHYTDSLSLETDVDADQYAFYTPQELREELCTPDELRRDSKRLYYEYVDDPRRGTLQPLVTISKHAYNPADPHGPSQGVLSSREGNFESKRKQRLFGLEQEVELEEEDPKRAYIKQYFTANAVRALGDMEKVTEWLRGD